MAAQGGPGGCPFVPQASSASASDAADGGAAARQHLLASTATSCAAPAVSSSASAVRPKGTKSGWHRLHRGGAHRGGSHQHPTPHHQRSAQDEQWPAGAGEWSTGLFDIFAQPGGFNMCCKWGAAGAQCQANLHRVLEQVAVLCWRGGCCVRAC